jgi:4-hydroxybutyrate CoA-transferase
VEPATPHRAAERLLDGRREATIVSAMAPQQPDRLLSALLGVARARQIQLRLLLADVTGGFRFLDKDGERDLAAGALRITMLAGSVPRRLAPMVDSIPVSLAEVDRLLANGDLHCDIFAARMHRARGCLRLGNAVGYTPTVLERPGVTVAVQAVGAAAGVAGDVLLDPELAAEAVIWNDDAEAEGAIGRTMTADPVRDRIAGNTARIVPRDATIQVGIGGFADSLIRSLAGRGQTGVHSGTLPAALRALLAAGDFTGPAKTAEAGLAVGTSIAPDAEAGPWPSSVRLRPLSQTHSRAALARHERLWAINSAFSVDLTGQVNAETLGGVKVACGAGQLDFTRAAQASRGGAVVIALPARTTHGQSRIVARFEPGAAVTTASSDVDYVVTEFGAAQLTGRTLTERARALAAVAHPDDRAVLLKQFEAGAPDE